MSARVVMFPVYIFMVTLCTARALVCCFFVSLFVLVPDKKSRMVRDVLSSKGRTTPARGRYFRPKFSDSGTLEGA